jgi:secondary thiamine-phosphate synthase enzyme
MFFLKKINVNSKQREILLDITREIEKMVSESSIQNGVCRLFVPHTTAGITINENADPSVRNDVLTYLAKLIPQYAGFKHFEGNSDAHIKSTIVGTSLEIPIYSNSLILGTWQGIMFAEFDGPRNRELYVQIQGE